MSKTIYGIMDDFEALYQLLEEGGGQEELQSFFIELCADFENKADNYARVIASSKAAESGIKDEINRLKTIANREAAKQERLKQILREAMEHLGMEKVSTDLHKFAIQANGGKRKVSLTIDASKLPDEYRIVEYKPNKDIIREELEEGVDIEGATLEPRGKSLRIR